MLRCTSGRLGLFSESVICFTVQYFSYCFHNLTKVAECHQSDRNPAESPYILSCVYFELELRCARSTKIRSIGKNHPCLRILYFKTLVALKIAAKATPTSAKTASHMVANPKAPKAINMPLTNMAKMIFCQTIL